MGGARLTQLTWQLLPFMWLEVDEGIKPTLYAAVSPDARGGTYYSPRGFHETVKGHGRPEPLDPLEGKRLGQHATEPGVLLGI